MFAEKTYDKSCFIENLYFPSPGGRGLRGGGYNLFNQVLFTLTPTLSRQGRGGFQLSRK
jgi:hypothetical protein